MLSPTREMTPSRSKLEFEPDYLSLVVDATLKIYDVCVETPLMLAPSISEKLGSTCYLKREDLQPIHSFKNRGAYNKVCSLTEEERSRGIVATSAGNHAQGVALAGKHLKIKSRIYCPSFAPAIKIANVRRLGAEVQMIDGDFDDAKRAMKEAVDAGMVFIPPFDDPLVIAGAGTVGFEILKQIKGEKLDAIFVCVGGGGLVSGIAAFVKRVRPNIKIIGVNTPDSNAMVSALEKHEPVLIPPFKSTFSDGTAVRIVGKENLRLCELYVDEMITVTNDEICSAIKDVFIEARAIIEPSGALGVAGMKKWVSEKPERQGGVYVAVCSGANINFDRLRFVADRANWGSGAEALLGVVLRDKPGALVQLLFQMRPFEVCGMTYRYNTDNPEKGKILVNVAIPPGAEASAVPTLVEKLKNHNDVHICLDLTNDDLAKEHIRSLIGTTKAPEHERLFVIRFLEKPGAMHGFLSYIDTVDFNVSLLHYKHSGGDVADMLVGVAVPPAKADLFEHILNKIQSGVAKGFLAEIDEVTDEPSYQAFLT